MTIDLACPGCGKSYSLPESQSGKRARCKRCGEEFRVDRPGPEPVVSEPPKLAYLEPSISMAKPPPPMMAPPPPPSLRPAQPVVIHPKPASARAVLPGSIPVECPHCGHRYDVETSLGGKRARCKSCREIFRLPEAAAVIPTPAAPVARLATAPATAPAWDAEDPEVKGWSWTIPQGGLGPLKVGLVAVGACVAVVGIGALIRAITHGADPGERPKDTPPVVVGRPEIGRPPNAPRPHHAGPAVSSAGFDPFPDEPPAPTIRDDVLRRHRSSFQGLADASERLVALLRAIDGPPDAATLAKKKAIESTIAELTSSRAALPRMNTTEEYRVFAEFAARLIDLGGRQKAEIRRLLSKIPADGFTAELRRQSARIDPAMAALRAGMTRGPAEVPCVDVICPDLYDPDGLLGDAIRARLETMTDTPPPEVFRFRSVEGGMPGRAGTGVRLGPVADPQAFARKIRFGTVASVKGRKITVVDVRADPADVAETRSARDRP